MTRDKNYKKLAKKLIRTLGTSRVITDDSVCRALGTDASFYRLTPKIVVKIANKTELKNTIILCQQHNAAYTFRAAGTSLSGQAVSDSVLIQLTDDWRAYEIFKNGHQIKLQPGIIGADANRYLAKYQRKIGPDPASIDSCKIGGIAANNASGMCCGTAQNSYQTLSSMSIILADGTLLDTGNSQSVSQFKQTHSELIIDIEKLAEQIKQDPELHQLIKHKYRLKNTSGYGLNALVDHKEPIDIIQHLMIGSEGTLGFIADITYNTVSDHPYKATALFIYENINIACQVVAKLSKTTIAAVEIMDGRALLSVAEKSGIPVFVASLNHHNTGLLLECQASSKQELSELTTEVKKAIVNFKPLQAITFTTDIKTCQNLWQVRKGLFPTVGAIREKGTSVIIEDVAFPIENLAIATQELQQLFQKYGYYQAIIFGHALEGNLHFVFTQNFGSKSEIERYKLFMQDVCQLVAVKYKGSLKAEHGTGRNMAPFVELEWGKKGYALMQQIKALFDPKSLMNPGVIINQNPNSHVSDLKQLPIADDMIDQCIECGFCETVCPSRNLSLTPRQRISMYRQLQDLSRQPPTRENKQVVKKITKQFNYLGVDTCAATGLCADRCPVGIDTGEFIKSIRGKNYTESRLKIGYRLARWTKNHFATTSLIIKGIFRINDLMRRILPAKIIDISGKYSHKLSNKTVPIWFYEYPTVNPSKIIPRKTNNKQIVYVPSCATRTLGTQVNAKDKRPLTDVIINLLEKAGFQVIIPQNINDICCGMPYESKGMKDLAVQKQQQLQEILWQQSQSGKLPILMDTSPCAKYTKDRCTKDKYAKEKITKPMSIFEPTEFVLKYLVNHLEITPLDETIMLHITCSSRRMGLKAKMQQLASQCANNVIVPENIECCGWAGDKGFTTPELNESALTQLKQQIPENCTRGYSNSITCEIGLTKHSGIVYQSILYLLDEVSVCKYEALVD